MNFIDLFSGSGGFSYVLENNGLTCVFANDMVDESQNIYKLNMDGKIFTLNNLNNVDVNTIPKHNILCAGFPCQPFSIAGKQEGFKDTRSNVFWKIVEILKVHKPKIIILENVKNLINHDKKNTFKIIINQLEEIGYYIKYDVLDTCKLTGIPHHRERIYIVGFLDKEKYNNFSFDFKEKPTKNIIEFLESDVDKKYYYSNRYKVYPEVSKKVVNHINTNTIYQYRRYYIRQNKNKCCPTLTANMGGGGHNVPIIKDDKGIRKLTPRECFNLQGFPTDYKLPNLSDSKLYKIAGNAITISVVDLIIKKLIH